MAQDDMSLAIRVALDNSNFQQGLQNMNRQIRAATAEFKNATAGLGDHGKGLDSLKAKSDMLSKQIDAQSKIVEMNRDKLKESRETLENNAKAQVELKEKIETTKKAYEDSIKTTGENSKETKALKEELDKLSGEYTDNEEKIRNNTRTLENYEMKVNNAEAKLKNMESQLKYTNDEIDKQSSKWQKLSDKLEPIGGKLQDIGGKMTELGRTLSLKLTAPIMAAGGAAAKLGMDFDKSMANIATLIPGQQDRLRELKKDIQDVAIATGKHTDDIADGAYNVISAYGDAADTMEKVEINAKAARAGLADTSDALNLSSAIMKGFGDTSAKANEKVMDLAFETLKLGQTSFAELAGSMGKVVPTTNELGISMEELFTVFATGTGVTGNASEVATQYQGVLKALMAPTKEMAALLKELGYENGQAMIAQEGLAGSIQMIVDKSKKTGEPLQKYIGSIQGQVLALALAGEQSDVYAKKLESLKNSQGAMEEAFKEQTEGINETGFTFEQAMIKMQVSAQKFGDAMGPMLAKVADAISILADKLNELTPAQMDNILQLGAALAIMGPVTGILGTLNKVIGGAIVGFTKMAGKVAEAGGMVKVFGLGLKALPLVGVAAGIGAVGYGAYKLVKHFKQASISVDEFGDDVSESTQEAVGAFLELEEQATKSLNELSWTGQAVTKEMADNISGNFNEMKEQVVSTLEEKKNDSLSALQDMFDNSKYMNEETKKELIESTTNMYDEQIGITERRNEEINRILQKAAEENRELTAVERQIINTNKELMKEDSIRILSESEKEQLAIMERLKQESGKISALQAAEIVQNSKEQKDKAVAEAEEEYNERLKIAAELRAQGTKEAERLADQVVAEAIKQKNESVKNAEEMHNDVVSHAKEQAGEHAKYVEWETGEVKSKWEAAKIDISEKATELKDNVIQAMKDKKDNAVKWTQETVAEMGKKWDGTKTKAKTWGSNVANNIKSGLHSKKQALKEKSEELKKSVKSAWNNIEGEFKSLGEMAVEGLRKGLEFTRKLKAKAEELATKTINAVKDKFKTKSPSRAMMDIGKNVTEGLAIGIEENAHLAQKAAEELAMKTIKEVETDLSIKPIVNVSESILKRNATNTLGKGKNVHEDYAEFLNKLNADEVEKSKKLLDEEYQARVKNIDKQVDALKAGDKKKNKARIDSLRKEKQALKENHNETLNLINERSQAIEKAARKDANIFQDKINQFDVAIKRLTISTGDLEQDLINQNAVIILQQQKVKELEKRYNKLAKEFGSTSDEATKMKKALEDARTELIKMGNDVENTTEKIKQSQIDAINDLTNRIKSALKQRYEDEYKMQEKAIRDELDALDKWKNESIDRINSVYDAKIKRIDETANAQIKALQNEIDALDRVEKQKTREEEDAEKVRKINRLKEALKYEHDEFNKAEIQKELNKEIKDRDEQLRKWQIEDRKEKLNQQINDIKDNASKQKETLERQKEYEINRINSIYEYEKNTLENRLSEVQEFYERKTQDAALQAEAEKMIVDNQQKEIIELLHSYEEDYKQAGQSLGEKLVEGFKPKIREIMDMIDSVQSSFEQTRNNAIRGMAEMSAMSTGSGSTSISNVSNSNSKVINNNVNISSPRALNHREVNRQTENTLRRLALI